MQGLRDCAIGSQRALLANLINGREDGETNYAEAQWIIEKLQSIARHKKQKWNNTEPNWSVFVITPYQAQLKLLIDLLRRSYYQWNEELHVKCCIANELEVRCLTADSCQGKETAISLISMVRTDKVGFLSTPNHILTMLSRASDYLMIVAHRSTFEADPLWRFLLKRMELCKALMYDDPRDDAA
ncbi:Regulator of nonsense transcripts 1 [Phytophthora nicotianae]|uniref:Regulator of nonsense transcripts 1 n=1 Tax=Phytophthora nicotianae TaxID=4792 RepID=A0A0W8CMH9_PHYNI|nr:Regulator of nonsense transcripts 1 [Phytophthora nicotianae]